MRWARQWIQAEGWDHRVRVLCDYVASDIDEQKRRCTRERIARLWKSFLASDALERQQSGGRGASGMGHPSLPSPRL